MHHNTQKPVFNVFVSVFNKSGLEEVIQALKSSSVNYYSSGGTADFLSKQGVSVTTVEKVTGYPSILGGRVKTLHPKIFGGILYRGAEESDTQTLTQYEIPKFDLVIVDLYPFAETLQQGGSHEEIIEKIDIGGVSLIRAAAKNFSDVMVIPGRDHYQKLAEWLKEGNGNTTLEQRKSMASKAFALTSDYDRLIGQYLANSNTNQDTAEIPQGPATTLRYGENPHQEATFYGSLDNILKQLNGKQLSYNNLVDVDAAVDLIEDFPDKNAFAVIKHTNPCGFAVSNSSRTSWDKALAGDPVSAFGGIIVANHTIDKEVASEIDKLFYEILIAPDFTKEALDVLTKKKNRIILKKTGDKTESKQYKSILNGLLSQDRDLKSEQKEDCKVVTTNSPDASAWEDLLICSKLVKHTKSNAIILVKNGIMIGSGTGQTSRVDALKQAIDKANRFEFDTNGCVMASDAFFPFPDCVEIGAKSGVQAIIQPGGSKNDQASIDAAEENGISMVFTGTRHFKH